MKRDMNLIRAILLKVEEEGRGHAHILDNFDIPGHPREEVSHHVWLLKDAGYLLAEEGFGDDDDVIYYDPRCLTSTGEDFLATIKNKDIWQQVLTALKSGKVESLDAARKIAAKFGEKWIEKKLGLDG